MLLSIIEYVAKAVQICDCLVYFFLKYPIIDSQNFKANPYFEDTKLTKTFAFSDEGTTKITGTAIRWKEGMVVAIFFFFFFFVYQNVTTKLGV